MPRAGQFPGGGEGPLTASATDDGVTMLRAIAEGLSQMVQAFQGLVGRAGTQGTFILTTGATLVVPNVTVLATSHISLTPINAAAATLMGSAESLYVSARTAGVSFTVATASGTPTGGEEFSYQVVNTL